MTSHQKPSDNGLVLPFPLTKDTIVDPIHDNLSELPHDIGILITANLNMTADDMIDGFTATMRISTHYDSEQIVDLIREIMEYVIDTKLGDIKRLPEQSQPKEAPRENNKTDESGTGHVIDFPGPDPNITG